MNTYELTLLFPETAEADRTRVLKMIADFIKKHKGEVNKQEEWGAKHLAYEIKKLKTAIYDHMLITLEPADQVELNRILKLEESLLRYLFVRV